LATTVIEKAVTAAATAAGSSGEEKAQQKRPLAHCSCTMSYFIAAISNGGGAPEQAYRKLQSAGACPQNPYAGKHTSLK
jgi:hypothetical protein